MKNNSINKLQTNRKKKNKFADAIIIICVVMSAIITFSVIYEYHRLNMTIGSGVLSALVGFWGGELLIVALRQIFGSDALKNIRKKSNTMIYDDSEYSYPIDNDPWSSI